MLRRLPNFRGKHRTQLGGKSAPVYPIFPANQFSARVASPAFPRCCRKPAALWAYDGWNNAAIAGSEIQPPGCNLPRAVIGGTLAVILVYLAANLAYFGVLPAPKWPAAAAPPPA